MIVALLSFSAATGVETTGNTWTIDLDDSVPDRRLVQHFANVPTTVPHARDVETELLASIAEQWGRTNDNSTRSARLRRGLGHLQRAAESDDLTSQFADLWLGLESVNGLLIDKYGLSTSFIARTCTNCGADVKVDGSSAGITYAVVELAQHTSSEAKAAREFRKAMQHGSSAVYDKLAQLPKLVDLLRKSLALAVADLIEMPADKRSRVCRPMYPMRRSSGELTVTATLFGLAVADLLRRDVSPRIVLERVPAGDEEPARTTFGNLRARVAGHEGSWGDVRIDIRAFDDPEQVGSPPAGA
jgi:hypothetical protein